MVILLHSPTHLELNPPPLYLLLLLLLFYYIIIILFRFGTNQTFKNCPCFELEIDPLCTEVHSNATLTHPRSHGHARAPSFYKPDMVNVDKEVRDFKCGCSERMIASACMEDHDDFDLKRPRNIAAFHAELQRRHLLEMQELDGEINASDAEGFVSQISWRKEKVTRLAALCEVEEEEEDFEEVHAERYAERLVKRRGGMSVEEEVAFTAAADMTASGALALLRYIQDNL